MTLRLASRGSTLALWQAHHVRHLVHSMYAGIDVQIDVLQTTGDRITDVPLAMIGDRGLFTKEVDGAVLDGRADIAVHSLKDLPTTLPDGLAIAAVLSREDARDAFVPARPSPTSAIGELPARARIGTSSLRRRALILAARPDLRVDDLRGNLDSRLERVAAGQYDGIVLALAGLRRFGSESRVGEILDAPHWLPAAGQGALAIVTRADDLSTLQRMRALDHADTHAATSSERSFLRRLEGGCQIPIGALADVDGTALHLRGLVASLDGSRIIRGEASGSVDDPDRVGTDLAARLLERGADAVLAAIRETVPHPPRPPAP